MICSIHIILISPNTIQGWAPAAPTLVLYYIILNFIPQNILQEQFMELPHYCNDLRGTG
jgi:hypothetical protein